MTKKSHAYITGLGAYVPEKVLRNADLEKMVDTSDEWITSRVGIKERRIAEENEFTSTMGAKAAQYALAEAEFHPKDLDAIIVATMTPDYLCPSTAALIQHELKAERACAIDVQAACTGFLYALSIAKGWVDSGTFQHVLVIASEKNSAFIDYQDRNTCVLFGDGAGAALVQRDAQKGFEIGHICLGADGEQADLLAIPGGGSRKPASLQTHQDKNHFLKMNGKELFKHAVRKMEFAAKECIDKSSIKEEDIDWIIPHQANLRIMEAISKRFNVPWEKVFRTIHKYGNTSASTIPIALSELQQEHQLKKGSKLLLVAFGGGLTWGATVLTKVQK
jgi:3-oxoacyl-[acyl-carrier-protein] synthase-3